MDKSEERSLQIDALNMCPPIGAMYAAFGVHACVPLSHGASGCCRFQRMELSKHFQKIVHVTSSMLREKAAIFGGEENLLTAVGNIFDVYRPEVVALHTTCLSETIGDDLGSIAENLPPEHRARFVYASTPGYTGSQLTGYSAMTEAFVRQLVKPRTAKKKKLCLIPGWLNPSDIDVIVQYAAMFYDDMVVFPDVRGVMDSKTPRIQTCYAPGGTPIADIEAAAECTDIIALGEEATWKAARALADISGAEITLLPLPVGIGATDDFIKALMQHSGKNAPEAIKKERQRLIDVLMELHPRFYGKTSALFCDADMDMSLTAFLAEIGIRPSFVCAGYAEKGFETKIREIYHRLHTDGVVLAPADRYDMEMYLKDNPSDFMLGGTRGKIVSRKLDIPLVRIGFPITDRPLSYLEAITGYKGCMTIMREILRALSEREEEDVPAERLSIAESF